MDFSILEKRPIYSCGKDRYCVRFHDYLIFSDGEVYSNKTKKIMKHDVGKHGYHQITLSINKKPFRIKVHRLVAFFFVNCSVDCRDYAVNHKDGNPDNNDYTNLEWCTIGYNNWHARVNGFNNVSESNRKRWENDEFRRRTSKNISDGVKRSGHTVGTKNPRYKYVIQLNDTGKVILLDELAKMISLSYTATYSRVKKHLKGIRIPEFEKAGVSIYSLNKGQSTIEPVYVTLVE